MVLTRKQSVMKRNVQSRKQYYRGQNKTALEFGGFSTSTFSDRVTQAVLSHHIRVKKYATPV